MCAPEDHQSRPAREYLEEYADRPAARLDRNGGAGLSSERGRAVADLRRGEVARAAPRSARPRKCGPREPASGSVEDGGDDFAVRPRAAARISGRTRDSTNTLMVPPRAGPPPTRSSLPESDQLRRPRPIASPISTTVAPSTHPPDTEPAITPRLSRSSKDPSGRGADPHALVTTARPSGRPSTARRS
jgi:hypothetical protein